MKNGQWISIKCLLLGIYKSLLGISVAELVDITDVADSAILLHTGKVFIARLIHVAELIGSALSFC